MLGATALSLLGLASPAVANQPWEASLTAAGEMQLSVLTPPGLSGEPYDGVQVYRCPEGGACATDPLPSTRTSEYRSTIDVSGSVGGDAFEARYSRDGAVVLTDRTVPWLGNAALSVAPSVVGDPMLGSTVKAVSGQWSGAWSPPWQEVYTELFACRTPVATDCAFLAERDYVKPFVGITLQERWVGWYLFARSQFWSGKTNAIGGTVPTPYGWPYPTLGGGPLVAISAPVGPIGPLPQQPVLAAKPATASIRARALRSKGRLSIARVTCPVSCRATLTVYGRGRKTLKSTFSVAGTKALTILPRHGRMTVTVSVDGKPLAGGLSVAR